MNYELRIKIYCDFFGIKICEFIKKLYLCSRKRPKGRAKNWAMV